MRVSTKTHNLTRFGLPSSPELRVRGGVVFPEKEDFDNDFKIRPGLETFSNDAFSCERTKTAISEYGIGAISQALY